ncbi:hypothetical protein ACFW04_014780 [Cataglyphis niger]
MRIEEDRDLVLVADEDIIRCFFLLGIALHWRTQEEQESVANYLMMTCLRAMYDRLSPAWSAAEQVSYAFRNMLPRLQIAMRRDEMDDLDALEDIAIRIEASHQLAQRYRTPDKSLFPDLAYRSPRHVDKQAYKHDTVAALNISSSSGAASHKEKWRKDRIAKTSPDRASRVSTAKCCNCDDIGHLSRDSEAAPRMHCYRCSNAEVIMRTCPDCSGKE